MTEQKRHTKEWEFWQDHRDDPCLKDWKRYWQDHPDVYKLMEEFDGLQAQTEQRIEELKKQGLYKEPTWIEVWKDASPKEKLGYCAAMVGAAILLAMMSWFIFTQIRSLFMPL